jgi:protein-tyrosine phosphatase
MFREVTLAGLAAGRLLLHSIPGQREALEALWAEAKREKVHAIVRLTEMHETRFRSPLYAAALESNTVPFTVLACEIPDHGVPTEPDVFWSLARNVASRLRAGEVILVHCNAGIGRTGTFAAAVLLALGHPVDMAIRAVSGAGSSPETEEQAALIRWCASETRNDT